MSDKFSDKNGVIHTPSRRLFLGTMVAGTALGLGGCSVMESLFGSGDSGSATGNLVAGESDDDKDSKVSRRVQRKKRDLGLDKYKERFLSFHHTHTGERLKITYWEGGSYITDALKDVNHLLRDFRSNDTHRIDPVLLDQLFAVRMKLDTDRPFHIISGYRSPNTNAMLRGRGRGGVAKHSLHMSGKAIDIRVPGRSLEKVRLAALTMQAGGVGYYAGPQFVHMDTGRVRRW